MLTTHATWLLESLFNIYEYCRALLAIIYNCVESLSFDHLESACQDYYLPLEVYSIGIVWGIFEDCLGWQNNKFVVADDSGETTVSNSEEVNGVVTSSTRNVEKLSTKNDAEPYSSTQIQSDVKRLCQVKLFFDNQMQNNVDNSPSTYKDP